jgi:site-specific DNA-methyltransferase (adenine-specific)/adenine-specific DNA-methyltransferase
MTSKKTMPAQEALQLDGPEGGVSNVVEKYEFEPIKGYPMLNWRGKRPFTSTHFYPAQLKELHGEEVDGWRNKIFWGDNLQVMSHLLKDFRGKVDLIYIDPPFDSKADYKKKVILKGKEVTSEQTTFEDKQYSDIWLNDDYLQFMYERLILLRELLTDTGNLLLHCDYHKNYLLRAILDDVFGVENFKNEITWLRSSSGKTVSRNIQRDTDTILWYCKSATKAQFYPVYKDLSDKSKAMYKMNDSDGRGVYQSVSLNKTSGPGPLTTYDYVDNNGKTWKCPKNGWRMREEKLRALENDGRLIMTGSVLREKEYWDERENKGKLSNNLWEDLPNIQGTSSEGTDYPTQKPESLLVRILEMTTQHGALVFDCFMGSGTTQAVAMKLGRRFIGADINLGAIQTTTRRLIGVADELRQKPLDADQKVYPGFEVYNVNHYDIFRNPAQARELLLEALEVQKLEFSTVFDGEKDGRMIKMGFTRLTCKPYSADSRSDAQTKSLVLLLLNAKR